MELKFRIGEYIRYCINGVCQIEDICKMDILGDGNEKMFYVLKSTSRQASTICVPVDNDTLTSKMEVLLSKEEIHSLIDRIDDNNLDWIEDKKKRTDVFKNIIKECDRKSLISLMKCISERKMYLSDIGKNLSSGDEAFYNQASGIIENEFSFVLGIEREKLYSYIKDRQNK